MDPINPSHSVRAWMQRLTGLLCLAMIAACAPTPQTTPLPLATEEIPAITLLTAPSTLCRSATQIRLVAGLDGPWPQEIPGTWKLVQADGSEVIDTGSWRPQAGEVLVGFPEGEPLPPGAYRLQLETEEKLLAEHMFAISEVPPTILRLELALTPNGPALSGFRIGTQHLYIRYAYTGACSSAPFWLTVQRDGVAVCRESAVVALPDGEGAIACYREDGEVFEPGQYAVEFELMGEARAGLTFEIADPPPTVTPTASPTPVPVCEKPFAAAGLMPDGTPYQVTDTFEWYTQAIYVGARCRNMSPGIPWESEWYRNGVLVRSAEGRWEGQAATAVVWDSLTGVSTNPFVPSGTYTVTLGVNGGVPLTTTLRVRAYIRPTATP